MKWIKITTDIFDDEKILLIESLPDAYSIIVVWFKLLCLAGKQNNSGVFMMGRIAYTDKMLATIFRMKETTVTLALKTFEEFGMIEIIDGVITIPNWGKHQNLEQIEARREYQKQYQREYRQKQKLIAGKEADDGESLRKHLREPNVNSLEGERELDNKKESKSVKETPHTLLDRLLPDYSFSEFLIEKIREWITYKTERREAYKEQGLKTLLRQIENNAFTYGDQAVCGLIDDSMANGWKGIIFDRLKQAQPAQRGYAKPTKAQELDDSYRMMAAWSQEGGNDAGF